MRNTISLLLFLLTLSAFSQRISFNDPDLTFSFKKPKNWEVFDDGYVVKVSPSAKDTANVFFTITYFQDPESFGMFPDAKPENRNESNQSAELKIDKQVAKVVETQNSDFFKRSYTFMKYQQRFVLETSSSNRKQKAILRKIIRSIRIKK